MKKITILFLTIALTLFLIISSFALTKEERAWKEDILTLLSLVKRVGDYTEVVDLIEVAPALKKDPEIRKAFITFAPPGATPPGWAKEEKEAPPVKIEVLKKIPVEVKEKPIEAKKKGIVSRLFSFGINTLKNPQTPFVYSMRIIKRKDRYWLGKKYYVKGDYSQAISEFEEDLKISPSRKKSEKYLMKSRYKKGRRLYKEQVYRQASREFEKILTLDSEHKKAQEYLNKCQAQVRVEVAKEVSIEKEPIPEIRPIEEEIPEKIVIAEAPVWPPDRQKEKEEAQRIAQEVAAQRKIVTAETIEKVSRWESEPRKVAAQQRDRQVSREEQRIKPTPLPKGARVIRSTDVVSAVRAEMVEGKMRVTITLSGERKYTISDRAQPPSIIIDIPHTINAVSPGRIVVNRGGVSTIEVTQHRLAPMEEARVTIRLSRFKEYEVRSEGNEIYVEFQE